MQIWCSAALAFFISLIFCYIWRGSYHEDFDIRIIGEDIIMSTVGIVAGFFILMFLHGKSDDAERLSNPEMWTVAGVAVVIYIAVWMSVWMLIKNNYLIAFCGYHFEQLLGLSSNNRPTFFSALSSALIYGLFYFFAIVCGTKIAQKRRKKRNTH